MTRTLMDSHPGEKNGYVDSIAKCADLLPAEQLPVPYYARTFIRDLWPATADYVSPLNSIFLVQCVKLEQLNQREFWLLRDGFIPLYHFFKAHPVPRGLRCKLLVEESLSWVVPQGWLRHVGTYRLIARGPLDSTTKCLICGVLTDAFHSKRALMEQFSPPDVARLRGLDKYIYLPARLSVNENHGVEYLAGLFSRLGENLTALDWQTINLTPSFAGYEFVELSDRKLSADNYFAHVILAKGAHLKVSPDVKGGRYVSLSPFHGYVVNDFIEEKPERCEERQRRFAAVAAESSLHPWSQWFQAREHTGQTGEG